MIPRELGEELVAALHEARPFVYAASVAAIPLADDELRGDATTTLERVDGALADAGEVLASPADLSGGPE